MVVLGTRTRGGKMEGEDKSTELWGHPNLEYLRPWLILSDLFILEWNDLAYIWLRKRLRLA